MSRKVFISVLGFSNYAECQYSLNDYTSSPVRFIQEATIQYLMQDKSNEWTDHDVAYVLLTEGAMKRNWVDNGHFDRLTGLPIDCLGLKSRLDNLNLPFKVIPICEIPDGNNEAEIWQIFDIVYKHIKDGDQLYFDLTHGFRYLPMLVLALINYAGFLKQTTVKSITYGNYEARNSQNIAPIVDLLPLSSLQDWSYAAGQFLDSGNVSRLIYLSKEVITPILRNPEQRDNATITLNNFLKSLDYVIDDILTCRGLNIIEATNLNNLISQGHAIETTLIPPLNPIFDKIKKSFSDFSPCSDINNGFATARWCLKNGLYQQAITILQENIVTQFCVKYQLNYRDEKQRELVNKAIKIINDALPEENWMFSTTLSDDVVSEQRRIIRVLTQDEDLKNTAPSFRRYSQLRNDINHSGMKANAMSASRIKTDITDMINRIDTTNAHGIEMPHKDKVFLNLSNHPSSMWCPKQIDAARVYGKIIDMAFPAIDETADEIAIATLVDKYLSEILDLAAQSVVTVHLMGELTFSFALLKKLQNHNITSVASTSKRIVSEETPGRKSEIIFQFERFRIYD